MHRQKPGPLSPESRAPDAGPLDRVALPERCACFTLRRAARALTRHYDRALAPGGLRATQFSALMAMHMRGTMTVGALAECIVADRTTLTRNLAVLAARGLVHAEPGEDRRRRQVSITPGGIAALRRALPLWREAQAAVRQGLGGKRLDAILDDLGDVTDLFGPGESTPSPKADSPN